MEKHYITTTILMALNDRMNELEGYEQRAKENIKTASDNENLKYWINSFNYWSKQVEDCRAAKKFISEMD